MDQDQGSPNCSICSKPNDQMLMLACMHDTCINCATSAYAEQIHIKGQNRELYACEICGEKTLLDTSTVVQLAAVRNSAIKLLPKSTLWQQTSLQSEEKKQNAYKYAIRIRKKTCNINRQKSYLKGQTFFEYLQTKGITDRTIQILKNEDIEDLSILIKMSNELLRQIGVTMGQIVKLKEQI